MIGWLAVLCTSTAKPHDCRRFCRKATWSEIPSPVRLTEAMRTESRSVRTSASERSRTAVSNIAESYQQRIYSPRHGRQAHDRQRHIQTGRQGLLRAARAAALREGVVAVGARRRRSDLGPLLGLEPGPRER